MALPSPSPSCGSFFAPNTTISSTAMTINSPVPSPNMAQAWQVPGVIQRTGWQDRDFEAARRGKGPESPGLRPLTRREDASARDRSPHAEAAHPVEELLAVA